MTLQNDSAKAPQWLHNGSRKNFRLLKYEYIHIILQDMIWRFADINCLAKYLNLAEISANRKNDLILFFWGHSCMKYLGLVLAMSRPGYITKLLT